ncbi:hypothetical protein CTI12_AA597720 [Artemisia annua]|uniref:Wax synthase domain-containing protein n=1 Tax=Artemisia annua TaxID=35608 RepID=A0A2U1KIQ2_ARTAN|nr:hypothetical protein CTI12_AA597720 [Artemisia annua]
MGGEVYNLIVDLSIALASLVYSHSVGMLISKGTARFLALFPVICVFVCLPLNLKTIIFAGPISFLLSWLGSFKLILYAFGQGPLSTDPALTLYHFIFAACLPIKIIRNQENASHQIKKKSYIDYAPKVILFILSIIGYGYKDYFHPLVTICFIAYSFVFMFVVSFNMIALLVGTILGVKLEPQFDEPHRATSVQNYWGKRWNLVVSDILRLIVYNPARAIFSYFFPERWVSVPAVMTTFLVSGIMHEMMFYHLGLYRPTWEVTWYFILQGLWIGMEIVIKKTLGKRLELPPILAWLITMTFLTLTTHWLFFPSFLRLDPLVTICKETMALIGFMKHGHLLSREEHACPFFG